METNQATAEAPMGINWDAVEGGNTDFSVQYPRAQWVHGEAKASGFMQTGGLFIGHEQYPNFSAEGFAPTVLITEDGTKIEGSAASKANIAVIRTKQQWVKDEKYNRNVPLVQALICVKGCDDLLSLSLKGATKSLDFQKAFNQHIAQNVAIANRNRPIGRPPIEPFALWFPLRAGEPVKITAKDDPSRSSTVTPPEMFVPEKIDRDYVSRLWVGTENYHLFAGFWKETTAWQKQPIWEQKGTNVEMPEFSGGDPDHFQNITDATLNQLLQLCNAKGLNEKELALKCTNGATDRFDNFSEDEGRKLIDTLKSV